MPHVLMIALWMAQSLPACNKSDAPDTAYQGGVGLDESPNPEDSPDDSPIDETGDPGDDSDGPEVQVTTRCPFEIPPTDFTGGLVQLAYEAPRSGAFSIAHEGDVILTQTGTVDWAAGTRSYDVDYIDPYTTLSAHYDETFTLEPDGDWAATVSYERLNLDGSTSTGDTQISKFGCYEINQTYKPDLDESSIRVSELVSADEKVWSYDVINSNGTGWTFNADGVSTSDWATTYTFETDGPETLSSPDRLGSCANYGDGSATCDMTQYHDSGWWETGHHEWTASGDYTLEFERNDVNQSPELRQWGTETGQYDGSGTRTWTELEFNTNRELHCSGSWDASHTGSWSCDNGATGSYS